MCAICAKLEVFFTHRKERRIKLGDKGRKDRARGSRKKGHAKKPNFPNSRKELEFKGREEG